MDTIIKDQSIRLPDGQRISRVIVRIPNFRTFAIITVLSPVSEKRELRYPTRVLLNDKLGGILRLIPFITQIEFH
ncbi:hypothetical protein NTGM5_70051 [Candidatus Nitrotoga sp. M5]|nr:hypothetical protein NTGM5_70051 [Candidatus Nitrotoga sp. M5]